jgi:diaminopimelate epimerase
MKLPFVKYQGTGNDFILLDDRSQTLLPRLDTNKIATLCNRHFGIGADGLIALQLAKGFDFQMIYFNSDGRRSTMCGNGGRCTVHFAHSLGLAPENCRFLAIDGPHDASIQGDLVHLSMLAVSDIESNAESDKLFTGSPHLVVWKQHIEQLPVRQLGAEIRYRADFAQEGINVNFVEQLDHKTLTMRTYERGVEDETLSCGTGVTAAAIAAAKRFGVTSPIEVRTPGGILSVSFQRVQGIFQSVVLSGPVQRVFEGEIALP